MEHSRLAFPEYNTKIIYDKSVIYRGTEDATVKRIVEEHKMKKNDIIFYNFGLWVGDVDKFKRSMGEFLDEIRELEKSASIVLPRILFLETFPQHFPTPNGYFDSAMQSKPCVPLSLLDETSSSSHEQDPSTIISSTSSEKIQHWRENHDWRNAIARQAIADAGVFVDIVGLAEGLYSQWDAHVDLDKSRPEETWGGTSDCTHYCSHSAVFQFIKASLQHALV